jgi:hypothetical protein
MHFARQGMPEPLPDKAVYGALDDAATAQLRRARRAADEARITGAHGDRHAVVNDGSNAAAQHDGNDYEEREHSSNDAHGRSGISHMVHHLSSGTALVLTGTVVIVVVLGTLTTAARRYRKQQNTSYQHTHSRSDQGPTRSSCQAHQAIHHASHQAHTLGRGGVGPAGVCPSSPTRHQMLLEWMMHQHEKLNARQPSPPRARRFTIA